MKAILSRIDHNFTAFTICREDNATTIPSELVLDYYDIRLDYWQIPSKLMKFVSVIQMYKISGLFPRYSDFLPQSN
jgi:hypothetical protein